MTPSNMLAIRQEPSEP